MNRRTMWAVALMGALLPGVALASGYNIYEQSVVGMGMAGTGTAGSQDASAIWFNPSLLTRLEQGTHVSGGFHFLTVNTSFAGTPEYPGYGVVEEMNQGQFPIASGYVAIVRPDRWAVGLGVFPAFGLGVDWKNPETFTGREIVTKADLRSIDANVTGALAFAERWSVAVGVAARYAQVELNRTSTQVYPGSGGLVNVATAYLSSDYTPGYGWNAGVSFEPSAAWRWGASYRSSIEVDIDDGDADFTQVIVNTGNAAADAAFNAAVAAGLPPDQGVATTLKFPAIWSLGTAWTRDTWTFEADANLMQWSIFDELPITFEQTASLNGAVEEEYEDAIQLRLGAEHRLPKWTYRFGYYFDQHAAPTESVSPLLPDTNRHGVSLGLGFPIGLPFGQAATLDLYQLSIFATRVSTEGVNRDGYDGQYSSYVNAFGLGVNVHF